MQLKLINRTGYATFDIELVLEQVSDHVKRVHGIAEVLTVYVSALASPCCPWPSARGELCRGYASRVAGTRIYLRVPPHQCHNRALAAIWLDALLQAYRIKREPTYGYRQAEVLRHHRDLVRAARLSARRPSSWVGAS